MQLDDNNKLITCFLPKGTGIDVIEKLKNEKGIVTANVNSARGIGKFTRLGKGLGEQTEKDLVSVIVSSDQADEIFEYIYDIANINRPHGGIIFTSNLQYSTPYILPDIPEEKKEAADST